MFTYKYEANNMLKELHTDLYPEIFVYCNKEISMYLYKCIYQTKDDNIEICHEVPHLWLNYNGADDE